MCLCFCLCFLNAMRHAETDACQPQTPHPAVVHDCRGEERSLFALVDHIRPATPRTLHCCLLARTATPLTPTAIADPPVSSILCPLSCVDYRCIASKPTSTAHTNDCLSSCPAKNSFGHPNPLRQSVFAMADEPARQISRRLSGHSTDRVHKSPTASHSSQSGSGSASLNPRSCVTCRRRKVKCDKKHPCTNCSKAHIDCVYPSPGRAPRKARKPPDAELMDRLRRLEGVVQSLGVQVDDEPQAQTKDSPQQQTPAEPTDDEILRQVKELKALKCKRMQEEAAKDPLGGLDQRFGRLVVDEGRSRYISNSFWANLNNEVNTPSIPCFAQG